MNRCDEGGLLVSQSHWLPTEAFDYNWGRVHPYIGCSRLRCGACGEMVRSWPVPIISRHYECRCNRRDEGATFALAGRDADDPGAFMSSWRCDGHPDLALPV